MLVGGHLILAGGIVLTGYYSNSSRLSICASLAFQLGGGFLHLGSRAHASELLTKSECLQIKDLAEKFLQETNPGLLARLYNLTLHLFSAIISREEKNVEESP